MPASNLQGLNIVHPAQDHSSADSQDLLLGHAYPDLTAQLDLWTNLSFESDEPLGPRHEEHKNSLKLLAEEEEEEGRSTANGAKTLRDGHANVVTPAGSQNTGIHSTSAVAAAAAAASSAAQAFDLNSFLASFGLDAFTAAVHHPQLQQQQSQHQPGAIAPSLAQLLALHSAQSVAYPGAAFPQFSLPTSASPSFSRNTTPSTATATEENHVPAKRARTRKASISTSIADSPEDASSPAGTSSSNLLTTPLSASEDKRRRNTAASARFRLKKKEREVALEGKAKELETKVLELERECEGLRRENGWLKGLVVGVTGAAAAPSQGLNVASSTTSTSRPTTTGNKRSREEAEKV